MTEKETLELFTTKHNRVLLKIEVIDTNQLYNINVCNNSYETGWKTEHIILINPCQYDSINNISIYRLYLHANISYQRR